MAIYKKVSKQNEIYIYMNGKLLYKRWLHLGTSKIFDVMPYDKNTLKSIK